MPYFFTEIDFIGILQVFTLQKYVVKKSHARLPSCHILKMSAILASIFLQKGAHSHCSFIFVASAL